MTKSFLSLIVLLTLTTLIRGADKKPFQLTGLYIDSCSCSVPCKCDLTGEMPKGCQGMGAIKITSGSYDGHDLSGVTIAYVGHAGEWSRLYVDAPDEKHRAAAEEFGRAFAVDFAPVEAVKEAKIEITGSSGAYTVTMDGGKIMKLTTEAVMGGDGKTALSHGNSLVPISPTLLQGKAATASMYHDGDRQIDNPAGRNVYFNDKMDSHGEL